MSNLNAKALQKIESLNLEYIRALDQLDMDAWLETFDKTSGSYTCISEENERNGLPIAFMLDDCYKRLQDRVIQVVDIQYDSAEHYQMRHFTQLTSATSNGDQLSAEFNFSVYFTRRDTNMTDLLCVGRYLDTITEVTKQQLKFLQRKAVLDTNVLPRYLVYPV